MYVFPPRHVCVFPLRYVCVFPLRYVGVCVSPQVNVGISPQVCWCVCVCLPPGVLGVLACSGPPQDQRLGFCLALWLLSMVRRITASWRACINTQQQQHQHHNYTLTTGTVDTGLEDNLFVFIQFKISR